MLKTTRDELLEGACFLCRCTICSPVLACIIFLYISPAVVSVCIGGIYWDECSAEWWLQPAFSLIAVVPIVWCIALPTCTCGLISCSDAEQPQYSSTARLLLPISLLSIIPGFSYIMTTLVSGECKFSAGTWITALVMEVVVVFPMLLGLCCICFHFRHLSLWVDCCTESLRRPITVLQNLLALLLLGIPVLVYTFIPFVTGVVYWGECGGTWALEPSFALLLASIITTTVISSRLLHILLESFETPLCGGLLAVLSLVGVITLLVLSVTLGECPTSSVTWLVALLYAPALAASLLLYATWYLWNGWCGSEPSFGGERSPVLASDDSRLPSINRREVV